MTIYLWETIFRQELFYNCFNQKKKRRRLTKRPITMVTTRMRQTTLVSFCKRCKTRQRVRLGFLGELANYLSDSAFNLRSTETTKPGNLGRTETHCQRMLYSRSTCRACNEIRYIWPFLTKGDPSNKTCLQNRSVK